jgi:hypothetical protein
MYFKYYETRFVSKQATENYEVRQGTIMPSPDRSGSNNNAVVEDDPFLDYRWVCELLQRFELEGWDEWKDSDAN